MGRHWYTFFPDDSKPVQEEARLDDYLREEGTVGLEKAINDRTIGEDNSAYKNLDKAAATTQKALQDIKSQVEKKCWNQLLNACNGDKQ